MAQDCPLCLTKEAFPSVCSLKDSLVSSLSTRNFTCPICAGVHEGLEKFTLHLVSHELEAKNKAANTGDVPTISIKEGLAPSQNLDSLDELLADFSEFVRQEDKNQFSYDHQVKLKTKAPNSLRMSPKSKLNNCPISPTSIPSFHNIQTPLPLHYQPQQQSAVSALVLNSQAAPSTVSGIAPAAAATTTTTNLQLPDRPVFVPPPSSLSSLNINPQIFPTTTVNLPPLSVKSNETLEVGISLSSSDETMSSLSSRIIPAPKNDMNLDTLFPSHQAPPSVPPAPPATPCTPQTVESQPGSVAPLAVGDQLTDPSSPPPPPAQVQCTLCGWNFDNDNFLQLHMVLMHSKRSQALLQRRLKKVVQEYNCHHCHGTFKLYEDFVSHLKQIHNDPRFVCHICAKIFKLRGSLLVHLRVVHNPFGEGSHHCKVCNRKFTNQHRRDVHEKKHVDNVVIKQFECSKCGMAFEEKGEFEIHMETHKTQHTCHCGRSFYTQAALFIHTMGHQNSKGTEPVEVSQMSSTLKVPECSDIKPVVSESLECFETPPQGFKCPTPNCEKVFKRESHLNQHVKVHDNRQWECDVCKKVFTTKYFLKKHKRLHTGETPYACNICGKSFTFQQSYHKHMLYHTDDKPYSCSQCGRAFKELSTLQNHERIHSGERPFACETCGKSFRQRVSYLVHRRIHTGVMPYVCNDCGKSFRYKVTQRTHKCLGKVDGMTQPHHKPLTNPLAEDNANINNDHVSIDLPQQIKDDLMSFRKTQGRKFLQGRIHSYLQKSKERVVHQSQMPSPLNQLEQLTLSDQHHQSQSMPNIETILFHESHPEIIAKEDPNIKTEPNLDDFDLQAFL